MEFFVEIDLQRPSAFQRPGDRQHLKEVYIIQQFGKYTTEGHRIAEKLRRENQENNEIIVTKIHIIKLKFSFIFCFRLVFRAYKNLLRII